MRVLMISGDKMMCMPGSAVRERTALYAREAGTLDVIAFVLAGAGIESTDGPLHIVPTQSRSKWLYILDAYRAASHLQKPDVITVQDPFETGIVGLLLSRLFNVPLHVQIHTDIFDLHFRASSLKNRVRVFIARFVLRHATFVRVVSERIARTLSLAVPITVLPIYTDITRFSHLPRMKHPRFKISLLYIGRLEKEKRVDMTVRALKVARDAGHDTGLTIVGDGSEKVHVRNLVRKSGMERFVEFVGWRDDIAPFLSQADVLLVPSVYEGYGLVIVEALAAGVPVIATDVGVAREAGAIVTDVAHFSETLLTWLSDGPRSAELKSYLYTSQEEYVKAYVADLRACISNA